MYCEFCGTQLPENANVCPNCGAKIKNINDDVADDIKNENNSEPCANDNVDSNAESNSSENNHNTYANSTSNANSNYYQANNEGWQNQYQQQQQRQQQYQYQQGPFNNNYQQGQQYYNQPYPPQSDQKDKNSVILNIVSFFIPLVGLILWLVDKDEKPIRSKNIGKSALAGLITGIVLVLIIRLAVFAGIKSIYNSSGDSSNYGSSWSDQYGDDDEENSFDKDHFNDFSGE